MTTEMITYDIQAKTLTWGTKTWEAVSGPFGKGPLERGTYVLERRNVTDYTEGLEDGFKDKVTGKGFFVPLRPTFETKRRGLGIHPDGNVPGTEGCIGIVSDAQAFYKKLGATAPSAVIHVEVR